MENYYYFTSWKGALWGLQPLELLGIITGIITGVISLSIATYAVVVARKNQKRNELFLYYQYELERIERILVRKARQLDIVKTPKEKVEIYDSLFKHQEAIDKILNKMKDDFSLVDR